MEAFGDENTTRMLYMFHHKDDEHPDDYVSRPVMTVLGFGRRNKDKLELEPISQATVASVAKALEELKK